MKSFDKITKGLRKMILNLDRLVKENGEQSIAIAQSIQHQHNQITLLNTEGNRAGDTATKLRALIGE